MVKRILLTIDDEDFDKLKRIKGEKSWEEFLVKGMISSKGSTNLDKESGRMSKHG